MCNEQQTTLTCKITAFTKVSSTGLSISIKAPALKNSVSVAQNIHIISKDSHRGKLWRNLSCSPNRALSPEICSNQHYMVSSWCYIYNILIINYCLSRTGPSTIITVKWWHKYLTCYSAYFAQILHKRYSK